MSLRSAWVSLEAVLLFFALMAVGLRLHALNLASRHIDQSAVRYRTLGAVRSDLFLAEHHLEAWWRDASRVDLEVEVHQRLAGTLAQIHSLRVGAGNKFGSLRPIEGPENVRALAEVERRIHNCSEQVARPPGTMSPAATGAIHWSFDQVLLALNDLEDALGDSIAADLRVIELINRFWALIVAPMLAGTLWVVIRNLRRTRRERESLEATIRARTAELSDSVGRLRAVLNSNYDAILSLDERGTIESINPAAVRMFGHTAEELLGQSVELLMPPNARAEHARYLQEHGKTFFLEIVGQVRTYDGIRKDGTRFPFELVTDRARLGDRTILTGILRDISARRRAERRQAAQYAATSVLAEQTSLVTAAPAMLDALLAELGWDAGAFWIVVGGEQGLRRIAMRWRGAEPVAYSAAGQPRELALCEGLPGGVWNAGQPQWLATCTQQAGEAGRVGADGLVSGCAAPILSRAAVTGVFELWTRTPTPVDEDLLKSLSTLGRQIGEFADRRRAERLLRENEERLQDFLEHANDLILNLTPQGRVLYANRAWRYALGLREEQVFSLDLITQVPEPERAHLRETLAQVVRSTVLRDFDTVFQAPKGGRIEVSGSAYCRYEQAQPVSIWAVLRDVTESRRITQELRRAKELAEETSRAKSDFLASMSHELRTPLNSIIGFASIMAMDKGKNLRDIDKTNLDRIGKNGRHLLEIINTILDISKIEAGHMEVVRAPTSLGDLVRGTLGELEGSVRDKSTALVAEVPAELAPFHTDAGKLRQILVNLVGNAIKFTDHGSVTVRVVADTTTREALRLEVADTGTGIPADKLGHIFEAFRQAESGTARKFGGTGLGLTISRSLARLMGYELSVASTVGSGSVFTLQFSARGETAAAPDAPLPPPAADLPTVADTGERQPTILIIDDEADSRALLSLYLQDFGCHVLTADSGASGLLAARAHRPDLIILDLLMPDMNGWQVMKAFKEDVELSATPVVISSVVADDHRSNMLGAVEFLEKPFERATLQSILERRLHRHRARILVIDDDVRICDVLEQTLGAQGYQVEIATSGEVGLAHAVARPPDLILMDMVMPGLSGVGLLDELRRQAGCSAIPIVMMTGFDIADAERMQLDRLVSVVLRKGPELRDRLQEEVRRLLMRATGEPVAAGPAAGGPRR